MRPPVDAPRIHELVQASCTGTIEPELYRYPAIDPRAFRRKVDEIIG